MCSGSLKIAQPSISNLLSLCLYKYMAERFVLRKGNIFFSVSEGTEELEAQNIDWIIIVSITVCYFSAARCKG